MKIKIEGHTYDYEPNDLSTDEAVLLFNGLGLGYTDLIQGNLDDPRYWVALVWMCRYRDGELSLPVSDVKVKFSDIELIPDKQPEPVEETPTVATLPEKLPESPSTANTSNGNSRSGASTGSRSAKRSA